MFSALGKRMDYIELEMKIGTTSVWTIDLLFLFLGGGVKGMLPSHCAIFIFYDRVTTL